MSESEFVRHKPCQSCGSSDGVAVYSDGHTFCFVCKKYTKGFGEIETTESGRNRMADPNLIEDGVVNKLIARGIAHKTCEKFNYRVGVHRGSPVQIAEYRNESGEIVAQHIRKPDKQFYWLGDTKAITLFGQHLWAGSGKRVVVTEGEIDCLSVAEVTNLSWPVVSLPNGAAGAKRDIMRNLQWLEGFDSVVLMFDNDEPGRKAVEECAPLFSPGKVRVATLPLKDANEMLVANRLVEVNQAIWNASIWRPDGIVDGTELWNELSKPAVEATTGYPWMALNRMLRGIRKGELVTFTGGTGTGKSGVLREIAYGSLIAKGDKVCLMFLEETIASTARDIMGLAVNIPLRWQWNNVPEEIKIKAYKDTIGNGNVYLFDHFGSTEIDNVLSKIRYAAKSLQCDWVILDHVSIVVSGYADQGDERKTLDAFCTKLRQLVQELNIGLLVVSHLKRPTTGPGHEDGAQTSLSHLRGSAILGQISDAVIGIERNQQAESEKDRNTIVLRVLKNRFAGETGLADSLFYDKVSGRLIPVDAVDLVVRGMGRDGHPDF